MKNLMGSSIQQKHLQVNKRPLDLKPRMKLSLALLLLFPFSAGCQTTDTGESGDLGSLLDFFTFFSELGDCLFDDEESTPDESGWITPSHPND